MRLCAHTQSTVTLQSARSKWHFSQYLQNIGRSAATSPVSLWTFANHCFIASLRLMAGQWDGSFCIQNTLHSCLCQRHFHYLTGDNPENLAPWQHDTQRGLPYKMMMQDNVDCSSSSVLSLCKAFLSKSNVEVLLRFTKHKLMHIFHCSEIQFELLHLWNAGEFSYQKYVPAVPFVV